MPNTNIDLGRGHTMWTELEVDLYEKLPIYLAKQQVDLVPYYERWGKILKPFRWTPNQGNLVRGVRKEPSPVVRSQALPNPITQAPKKDVIAVREVTYDGQLYMQDFNSNIFQFLPSFTDFLNDHVDTTMSDMTEKIMVYKDLFYRTAIFHGAPKVWICGKENSELTSGGVWTPPTIQLAKNQEELQNYISDAVDMLTMRHLKKLATVLDNDVGATPYSGKQLPDGTDGSGLNQKYLLICGSEVWDSFTDLDDDYVLKNKNLNLDVVTNVFRGSLFGRWTTMHERFEMRIAADGTVPAPQTIEANPNAIGAFETIPNPAYVSAPYGVAFAVGAEAYKAITVGPPPGLFSRGSLTMDRFQGMNWNGKVHMTRNILVPTLDESGALVMDTNKYGDRLMLIAELVMGIMPLRPRNIVPIIYQRKRTPTP